MGYTTEFDGHINIAPPLNAQEIKFIRDHNATRRMKRNNGAYYVGSTNNFGQDKEADIIEYNAPPEPQLSLWCGWTCNDEGTRIEWDGGEKFYSSAEWMKWLIEHILGDNPLAKTRTENMRFLQGHTLNGEIQAQGEESDDKWLLTVKDNKIFISNAITKYEAPQPL